MNTRAEFVSRFWANVTRPDFFSCWTWDGGRKNGYGRIKHEGRSLRAHRIAWEIRYGPIPDGLCVCHSCDQPSCVNPAHLFLGTHKENMRDMVAKGRCRPPAAGHGSSNTQAKLTEDAVRDIRAAPRRIVTANELAAKYGVSRDTVYQVRNVRNWKCLDEVFK